MSEDLTVSTGHGVAVSTDSMLAAAEAYEEAAREALTIAGQLADIAWQLHALALSLPQPTGSTAELVEVAASASRDAVRTLAELATGLHTAAFGYGLAERTSSRLMGQTIGSLSALVGRILPVLVAATLPAMAVGAGLAFLAPKVLQLLGLTRVQAEVTAIFRNQLVALLSDPFIVGLIRHAAMAADDLVIGAAGAPVMAGAVGEDGLGITGIPFTATLVVALVGAVGLLRETEVQLVSARPNGGLPPDPVQSWAERFARIPAPSETDSTQVLIERYAMPDGTQRYEVYVTGTVTFDPIAGEEPWDMTSNIQNARGAQAASVRAVIAAMREAGIDAGSQVQLTGYSQGGAVVARVAASEQFNIVSVVTFGGNTGQIAIPDAITTVLVEHDDDLVPALGGRQDNAHALLIRRRAYESGAELDPAEGVPAHRRPVYAKTAELMDSAVSQAVLKVSHQVNGFAYGAVSMETTRYQFGRDHLETT